MDTTAVNTMDDGGRRVRVDGSDVRVLERFRHTLVKDDVAWGLSTLIESCYAAGLLKGLSVGLVGTGRAAAGGWVSVSVWVRYVWDHDAYKIIELIEGPSPREPSSPPYPLVAKNHIAVLQDRVPCPTIPFRVRCDSEDAHVWGFDQKCHEVPLKLSGTAEGEDVE